MCLKKEGFELFFYFLHCLSKKVVNGKMDVYSSFIGAGRDVHFVLFYLRHGGKRKKEKEERSKEQ